MERACTVLDNIIYQNTLKQKQCFKRYDLRLVNGQCVAWHQRQLKHYRLAFAFGAQGFRSNLDINVMHIGEELRLLQGALLYESCHYLRMTGWKRHSLLISLLRVPIHDATLRAVRKTLVNCQVASEHNSHHMPLVGVD